MSTDDSAALLPEGTDVIVSSSYNVSGSAYHTRDDCDNVKKMQSTQRIDVSIARWKGHEQCSRCEALEAGDE